jgi:2-polyprenyl-6-methoxyphenol hydroxylase-like FAD-dependent oxidoreductase
MSSTPHLGRRAIIAGGSLAGLLGARAVAQHFDQVVIVERDVFSDEPAPRKTVPQSAHLHMLLKGGENAIERMLPGFRAAIEASGSEKINAGLDFVAGSDLGVAPRRDAKLVMHGQSRWHLEHELRRCVLAQVPNLVLHTDATARGLLYDAERNLVYGLRVDGAEGAVELPGDLVIDATGRSEVGLKWLRALGVELPPVEEVQIDFGYTSVVVELEPDPERDWKGAVCGNLPRVGARGAVLSPIEGGLHICSLGGRAGDYPPGDREGLLEFAKSLPQPTIYEALETARFASPIARMVYPANRFRHYERLASLPSGLIPLGDAMCSFNPTYGQGMSSAALQAEVLFDVLSEREASEGLAELLPRYLERAAEVARTPWRQANFSDFLYPTTEGDRSMFTGEEMQYRIQLQLAAPRDEFLRDLTGQVNQLLLPFERLLEDDVRARVAALDSA